jgi:hypothetical protein
MEVVVQPKLPASRPTRNACPTWHLASAGSTKNEQSTLLILC